MGRGAPRFLIRAELDAFFFRLYGIERDDVDYIMETFQTETGGLKHNDIAKYGSYRTKETILEFYDRMAAADAAEARTRRRSRRLPGRVHGIRPKAVRNSSCPECVREMVQRQSARGAGRRAV